MFEQSLFGLAAVGSIALSGGGTGLLSVPSAGIMAMDAVEFQHSNGLISASGTDSLLGLYGADAGAVLVDHVQFSILPRTELGLRVTTIHSASGQRSVHPLKNYLTNDLSGHAKFQVLDQYGFRLALGARDFGGSTRGGIKLSPAEFVVADYRVEDWLLVLGYGVSDDENVALDGPFGGLKYTAGPWLNLLLDYDAVETHVGFQAHTKLSRFDFYFNGYHSSSDHQDFVFSAGMRTQLGYGKPLFTDAITSTNWLWKEKSGRQDALDVMFRAWSADEFALRYQQAAGAEPLGEPCSTRSDFYANTISLMRLVCEEGRSRIEWLPSYAGPASPYRGHLDVRLVPILAYLLATELGRFEYSLAIRATAQWNLAWGFAANASWDQAVRSSADFRRGGRVAGARLGSQFLGYELQHTSQFLPGSFLQLTAGNAQLFGGHVGYKRAEVATHFFDGRLALNHSSTRFSAVGGGSFRPAQNVSRLFYWLQPGRYGLEFMRGKFFFGDHGYRVDLHRYIGRTRLGFFYRHGLSYKQEAVGMEITLALTGREAVGNRWVSVKGAPQYTLPFQTTINNDDGSNSIAPGFMVEFFPQRHLVRDVLDRWRMSPSYLRAP